jgi:hypothetical protein
MFVGVMAHGGTSGVLKNPLAELDFVTKVCFDHEGIMTGPNGYVCVSVFFCKYCPCFADSILQMWETKTKHVRSAFKKTYLLDPLPRLLAE